MIAPENGKPLGNSIRKRGRADTRLIERAIREKWPIPDEVRQPIVERQVKVILDSDASEREKQSAVRSLLDMDRINQADNPQKHLHLHADAESLTDADLIRIANSAAGGADSTS